jgi:hypothetical protein
MIKNYLQAYYQAYGNYRDLIVSVCLAIPNREFYEPEVSSFHFQELRWELVLLRQKRYSSAYFKDRTVALEFKKQSQAYMQALDDVALAKKEELILSILSYEEPVQEYFLQSMIERHKMTRRLLEELREFVKVQGLGRLRLD